MGSFYNSSRGRAMYLKTYLVLLVIMSMTLVDARPIPQGLIGGGVANGFNRNSGSGVVGTSNKKFYNNSNIPKGLGLSSRGSSGSNRRASRPQRTCRNRFGTFPC